MAIPLSALLEEEPEAKAAIPLTRLLAQSEEEEPLDLSRLAPTERIRMAPAKVGPAPAASLPCCHTPRPAKPEGCHGATTSLGRGDPEGGDGRPAAHRGIRRGSQSRRAEGPAPAQTPAGTGSRTQGWRPSRPAWTCRRGHPPRKPPRAD